MVHQTNLLTVVSLLNSSGIGEATALALAVEGATVVIAARRSDRLQDLKARITGTGGKALSITADVSDEAQNEILICLTEQER
ncbi:SDR family NAD(P)-dependent oxidoreductase [Nostoc sp.]|uniref:SDR family NAD(P)-dependent oxidoreductase n=1 Tax=Nostoc sp. TaxID=1180 RepID=UPI0035932117